MPPKSETILASTTNKMLQQLARDRGMIVEERPIAFEEIAEFDEVGMVGTAAVVVRVASITRGDTTIEFTKFDTIASLRATLTGIQCGDVEDKHGWMSDICPVADKTVTAMPSLSVESHAPGMVDAETKGNIQPL